MCLKKKTLMCYRPGARGDFLLSLMSGSIRNVYNELFAVPHYPNFIKMHNFGDVWHGKSDDLINNIDDLSRYRAFRIMIEDFDDAKLITYLMHYKMPFGPVQINNYGYPAISIANSLSGCLQFELTFRPYNNTFIEIIPFKKVFDFNYLMEFCYRHSEQTWSNEDLDKININIALNEKLTAQMDSFYNGKFDDVRLVNVYRELRSNTEKFSELPTEIDFLGDWEFVNGR